MPCNGGCQRSLSPTADFCMKARERRNPSNSRTARSRSWCCRSNMFSALSPFRSQLWYSIHGVTANNDHQWTPNTAYCMDRKHRWIQLVESIAAGNGHRWTRFRIWYGGSWALSIDCQYPQSFVITKHYSSAVKFPNQFTSTIHISTDTFVSLCSLKRTSLCFPLVHCQAKHYG